MGYTDNTKDGAQRSTSKEQNDQKNLHNKTADSKGSTPQTSHEIEQTFHRATGLQRVEGSSNSRYQVVLAKAQVYSKTQQPGPKCPSTTDVAPAAPETQPLQLATKSKTSNQMQCRPVTALT